MSANTTCVDLHNHLYEETIMCLADAYVHFRNNYFLKVPVCKKDISNKYVRDCFYSLCEMVCDGRCPDVLELEADMMINGARNEMADVANCITLIKYALPALQQMEFNRIDTLVQDYGSPLVYEYVASNYREEFVEDMEKVLKNGSGECVVTYEE